MKIFEINDSENRRQIGILLYYEKEDTCIIELRDDLDEWSAPLLFTGLVKKQIYTVPSDISAMWVRERVVPSGRQNIGSILSVHGLQKYDEMKFLEISKGKCSQDSLYVRSIRSLPDYVAERMTGNLTECIALSGSELLCFFADEAVRKIDLSELLETEGVAKILKNRQLMESARVGVGGYSVNFGGSIDIPARVLYTAGIEVPLSAADFRIFVRKNILDTADCCSELECSRQNLAYLQEKKLTPVRENVRGSLYMKGDVLRSRWT